MSAPTHNGNGFNGGGGPMAPPQNLEAEQSVLGAVLLSDTALPALIIDERLTRRGLLPREPRPHLPGDARPQHARRARRRADDRRAPQAGRRPRVGRRPAAVELLAGSVPAVGNVRQYARIVRDNAMLRRLLHASYEIQAQVHGHEALPRDLVDRAERADPRGRPRGLAQGLPLDRAGPRLRARQAPEALARGHADHRHPLRLRGPRQHHRRLPARQPDHPRRTPIDGQIGASWPTSPRTPR